MFKKFVLFVFIVLMVSGFCFAKEVHVKFMNFSSAGDNVQYL